MIEIHCAHDEVVNIKELKPNPKNPNQHPPEQLRRLARIITESGWRAPITVSNRSGMITKGHGRLMAAKLAGIEKIPVDRQDYESEAAEVADMLADNQIAELSYLDNDLLSENLDIIGANDFDLELTGFDAGIFEELANDIVENEIENDKQTDDAETANEYEYKILIDCESEEHQFEMIDMLDRKGIKCRALIS